MPDPKTFAPPGASAALPAAGDARLERDAADFLENAAIGLHRVGPDGTILWANRAELKMLGYDATEYVGRHISEFHVDPATIEDMLKRVVSGEELVDRPARLRCKDGSVKYVRVDSNGYFEDGSFVHTRCFTRDVSASIASDRDLALLATIVESSQDAIITKTLDGIITSWNAAAERMLGYAAIEAVGRSIMMLIPADRVGEEHDILAKLRRGQRVEHYETIRIAKGGRPVEISLTISPIRDNEGNIIGASKIARDIGVRKAADRALKESEQRFASFMQCLPGLAWIKDEDGRYVFANDAVEKPFGVSRGELIGKTDEDLFDPTTAAQFRENDKRALQSGQGVRVIETLEQADGTHYSIVSKFPIPGEAGEGHHVGGVAIDITDRMRAEQALMESDRRKDEFLATLAHELRNPLAPIRNSLHILRMTGGNSPTTDRVHEMMERQVAHMVRLVDDLLELSRISRGKIELKREAVSLRTIVESALDTSRPLIEGGSHKVEIELPEERIMIDGDLVRLSQVFANLFNNAAKYSNEPGLIRVRAERHGDVVITSIRDSGIGIPANMLGRVFDMFAQIDNPLRRSQDGLGIGLSLVRTLVLMHGGKVEARSEGLGQGSEFVVTLPITDKADPQFRDPSGTSTATHGIPAACRILVVDDNRDAADSLCMMLRILGADVSVAYGGASALEAMKICRPGLVLMDLGMPEMGGCQAARKIRADPENDSVVLVALTGWGQEEDRRQSREAGFDSHLVKPVELAAVQALMLSCVK